MEPVLNSAVTDLLKVAHRPEEQTVPTELAAGFEAQMAADASPIPDSAVLLAEIGRIARSAVPVASGEVQGDILPCEVEVEVAVAQDCPDPEIAAIDAAAGGALEGEGLEGVGLECDGLEGEESVENQGICAETLPEKEPQWTAPPLPAQLSVAPKRPDLGREEGMVMPDRSVPGVASLPEAAAEITGTTDAPALRVEHQPAVRQENQPLLDGEQLTGTRASTIEAVAGMPRDPRLVAAGQGGSARLVPVTQQWTRSMPVLPLIRAEVEPTGSGARETMEFWAATPTFGLSLIAQPHQMAASTSIPFIASPDGLCRQISEAVLKMKDDRIEIALSPEELGSVRLVLSRGEAGAAMTVWVERPEVLEMLRRNAEVLLADLQKSGLGDATLAFQGGGGADRGGAGQAPDGLERDDDRRADFAGDAAAPAGNGPGSRSRSASVEGLRLDIRV